MQTDAGEVWQRSFVSAFQFLFSLGTNWEEEKSGRGEDRVGKGKIVGKRGGK